MALAGKGVLAIWNGIAPEAETDFVAWHVREHIRSAWACRASCAGGAMSARSAIRSFQFL